MESWNRMDIAYLLWLQGIRESLPPFVEQVFLAISAIAISKALVVLPCLLYWCINKRAGQYVLMSFSFGGLCNQLIKNTVCCYRPWIRDAAVHPAKDALAEATGYSFPSGHTQAATNIFGAIGWFYREKRKTLSVLCWVFVVLVAFSRNFLGVHTPQDVIVGLLEGIVVIAAVGPLLRWVDEADGRDLKVTLVFMAIVVAFLVFATVRPYPMDYDAAGNLLVDPEAMKIDCYKISGLTGGAVLGWFFERKYLNYTVDPKKQGWKRMAVRFVVGIAVVVVFTLAAKVLQQLGVSESWYQIVKNFLTGIAASFVGPAAFCAVERRTLRGGEAA